MMRMRTFPLLLLAACSGSPHTFAQVEAAIAKPTGTVDDTTTPQFLADNQTRAALLGAAQIIYANTPLGYRRHEGLGRDDLGQQIYDTTCQGLSKDGSQNVKTVNLQDSPDGGATGSEVVTLSCKSDDSFALDILFKSACTQTLCFSGELRAQYTQTLFVWSLRADTQAPGGGPGGVADMGGTAVIDATGYNNDQIAAWFGKTPAPIVLSWSAPGINQYSEFFLKGTSSYVCHASTNAGTCDLLNADGSSTDGAQIKWGTPGT